MVVSPVVGLCLGHLVMTTVLWTFRGSNPRRVSGGFRYAQTGSAAYLSYCCVRGTGR